MYEDFPKITDFHRIFSEELPELEEDVHTADISYSKEGPFFSPLYVSYGRKLNHMYTFYDRKEGHRSRFYS